MTNYFAQSLFSICGHFFIQLKISTTASYENNKWHKDKKIPHNFWPSHYPKYDPTPFSLKRRLVDANLFSYSGSRAEPLSMVGLLCSFQEHGVRKAKEGKPSTIPLLSLRYTTWNLTYRFSVTIQQSTGVCCLACMAWFVLPWT